MRDSSVGSRTSLDGPLSDRSTFLCHSKGFIGAVRQVHVVLSVIYPCDMASERGRWVHLSPHSFHIIQPTSLCGPTPWRNGDESGLIRIEGQCSSEVNLSGALAKIGVARDQISKGTVLIERMHFIESRRSRKQSDRKGVLVMKWT